MKRIALILLVASSSPACLGSAGQQPGAPADAAVAGPPDAGAPDAGSQEDAGPPDAGSPDSGLAPDAGAPGDAGTTGSVSVTPGAVNPGCPSELAEIVSWSFRSHLDINVLKHATVTVRNTGSTAWTEADGFRLGAPGDVDPFMTNARVSLPGLTRVEPGATWTFTLDLRAPEQPGAYSTSWQMVHEGACWFGDVLTASIDVSFPVATGVCADPVPHGLDQMGAVVHNYGPHRITLDSTPKVCDREYCSEIGFWDGRGCCPPRPEGHPDVDVCNEFVMGLASDTGRAGPTWTFDGQLCSPGGPGDCENHPTNQFLLWVHGPGTARACGNLNGICGTVVVQ